MIYGELRVIRQQRQMTLAQLSDRTGIAQPNLSRLERGGVDARLSTVLAVADALGFELTLTERATLSLDDIRDRMRLGRGRLGRHGSDDRQAARRLEWKRRRGVDTTVEERVLG